MLRERGNGGFEHRQAARTGARTLLLLTVALAGVLGGRVLDASPNPAHTVAGELPTAQPSGSAPPIAVDVVQGIEVVGNFDRELPDGSFNTAPRRDATSRYLARVGDHFDFVALVGDFDYSLASAEGGADPNAFYVGVRNDVVGIGEDVFDDSGAFGSNSVLQGFIDLGPLSQWSLDPLEAEHEQLLSVLAHEIMHRWSARVGFVDSQGQRRDDLSTPGAHWSPYADTGDGNRMYGNRWQPAIGGFESQSPRQAFHPLDLYLAGLLAPTEVPPLLLLSSMEPLSEGPARPGLFLPEPVQETVTIQDVIAAEGPRLPSHLDSQKRFRVGLIVATRPGAPLDPDKADQLRQFLERFEDRFAILTGGRATVDTSGDGPAGDDAGESDDLLGNDIRDTPASLVDAFAWLRTQQGPAGSWEDRPATRLRDTATALQALTSLDPAFARTNDALIWLRSELPRSFDQLARRATVLAGVGGEVDPLLAPTLDGQNGDGGWGSASTLGSTPLDTALVLGAAPSAATRAGAALAYLADAANADGGWGAARGGPSDLEVTFEVLRAIEPFSANEPAATARAQALSWVAAQQNPDGGFGVPSSGAHATAAALQALVPRGATGFDLAAAANYLVDRQEVSGAWEGSVYTTARVAQALSLLTLPNLVFSTVLTLDDDEVYEGDEVELSIRVRNAGAVASAESSVSFTKLPDDTFTSVALPALDPGEALQLSAVWDSTGAAGTVTLEAFADPAALVAELSENDNRARASVTVLEASAGVELEIRASEAFLSPSTISNLPTEVAVAAVLRNNGLTDANGVQVELRRGSPDGEVSDAVEVPFIASRSSQPVALTYVKTTTGAETLYIVADSAAAFDEADESNNVVELPLELQPNHDLVAESVTLASPALLGMSVPVELVVRNAGTLDANNVLVRAQLLDGAEQVLLFENTPSLAAGSTATLNFDWAVDRVGPLQLRLLTDAGDAFPEGDESNNDFTLDFIATEANEADLAVGLASLTAAPFPAREGQPLTLELLVENLGLSASSAYAVEFFAGLPESGGVLLGQVAEASLNAGASRTSTLLLADLQGGADREIFGRIVPGDPGSELRLDNHLAFLQLEVDSLPDLAIAPSSILLEPPLPLAGDTVTIQVDLTNLGDQPIATATIAAFADAPDAANLLATAAAAAAGNGTTSVELTWLVQDVPEFLWIVADPDQLIAEGNENNNQAALALTFPEGDAFASPAVFSPNGDGTLDETTFFFFDLEPGPGDWLFSVLDARGTSVRQRLLDPLSTGGTAVWDGRDDLGRVAADGRYQLTMSDAASGAVLAQATATLDTNRSGVLEAIGSRFEDAVPLTCEVANVDVLRFSDADRRVFVAGDLPPLTNALLSRPLGSPRLSTLLAGQAIRNLAVSSSGRELVFESFGGAPLTRVDSLGQGLRPLPGTENFELFGFRAGDDSAVFATRSDTLYRVLLDGVSPAEVVYVGPSTLAPLAADSAQFAADTYRRSFSDDGRYLTLKTPRTGVPSEIVLVDLVSGAASTLASGREAALDFAPNSQRFLLTGSNQDVLLRTIVDPTVDAAAFTAPLPETTSFEVLNDFFEPVTVTVLPGNTQDLRYAPNGSSAVVRVAYQLSASDPTCFASPWIWYWLLDPVTGEWQRLTRERPSVICSDFARFDSDDSDGSASDRGVIGPPIGGDPYQGRNFLPSPTGAALWLSDREVVFESSGSGGTALMGIDLATADLDVDSSDVLTTFELPNGGSDLRDLRPTDSGRELLFTSRQAPALPEGACASTSREHYALRSLANLTAELRVERDASGAFEVRGTATDLHLRRWFLEFRPATAAGTGSWAPLGVAQANPVIDDWLATWSPPASGSFELRLTVEDAAGNRRSTSTVANAPQQPSLTLLELTERLISPNGDGVLDQTTLSYRALSPVELTFEVRDAGGNLLRTGSRQHVATPVDDAFVWDGRDDRGNLVADGNYELTLQQYRFFVEVDRTPPTVTLELDRERLGVRYVDGNRPSDFVGTVERGDGSFPSDYALFAALDPDIQPQSDGSTRYLFDLSHAEAVGGNFRVTAFDAAGNRVVGQIGPLAETVLIEANAGTGQSAVRLGELHGQVFGDPQCDAATQSESWPTQCATPFPTELLLQISETTLAPLVSGVIEYRPFDPDLPAPGDLTWAQAPISGYSTVAGSTVPGPLRDRFLVRDDLAFLDRSRLQVLRLRFEDAAGNQWVTRSFRFRPTNGSTVFRGRLFGAPDWLAGPLAAAGLDANSGELVWATTTVEDVRSASLFLQSNEDSRYLQERRIDAGLIVVDGPSTALVFPAPLSNCFEYQVRVAVTTGAAGSEATQGYQVPCLDLAFDLERVTLNACAEPPPTVDQRPVSLLPETVDGTPLQLLTTLLVDAAGQEQTLDSLSAPASGERLLRDVDLSLFAEGTYSLEAELSNTADVRTRRRRPIAIDRTPPVLQITYPLEGDLVCGAAQVEGSLTDNLHAWVRRIEDAAVAIRSDLELPPAGLRQPLLQGALLEEPIGGIDGAVDLVLTAWDAGGNRVCAQRSFFVDALVQGPMLEASARTLLAQVPGSILPVEVAAFSPNGDGAFDQLTVRAGANEPTRVTLRVCSDENCAAGPVRTLADDAPLISDGTFTWDGRSDAALPVPDGVYYLLATFEDGCGNTTELPPRPMVLDTTAPAGAITYPTTVDPLPAILEILGTLDQQKPWLALLNTWESGLLEWGVPAAPANFAPIAQLDALALEQLERGDQPALLGRWSASGLVGEHTLRLTLVDAVGNSSQFSVLIDILDFEVLIEDLEVAPLLFSPNQDGRVDTQAVRLQLVQPSTVDVLVRNEAGQAVRTLAAASALAAGPHTFLWDGRADDTSTATDGSYSVEVRAEWTSNPAVTQTEQVTSLLDATPPAIDLLRPSQGVGSPTVGILASIEDERLTSYTVELRSVDDNGPWQTLSSGTQPVVAGPVGSLEGRADGAYEVRLQASDAASNDSQVLEPFVLDSTPPEVTFVSPLPGTVLRQSQGAAAIVLDVVEANLESYLLEVAPAGSDSWQPIATDTSAPPASIPWDPGSLADGPYTLRATVTDRAGQVTTTLLPLALDDSSPVTSWIAPPDGAFASPGTDLLGTASDANLSEWRLEYRRVLPTAGAPQLLAQATEPVEAALIHRWSNLPPDGTYLLTLTATDRPGNSSSSERTLRVDLTPPQPAGSLTAEADPTNVTLQWAPSPSPDVTRYDLYRAGSPIGSVPAGQLQFTDGTPPEGTYSYSVVAVDEADLESEDNPTARIAIDFTPPELLLLSPNAGDAVAGLVPIVGSVLAEDLAELRLLVAIDTASPVLLHRSTLPVVAAELTTWDTGATVAANATLILEAEDVNGNEARLETALQIDNQAPAAPLGLAAAASGSDVDVSWSPNAEPDLLGYLLERDGFLVNLDGAETGLDLRPFALTPTTFVDLAVPDGIREYRLRAIDQLGNVSGYSAPVTAEIETGAPSASILSPADQDAVERPSVYLLAGAAATDVTSVEFQARAAGAGGPFLSIGTAAQPPWESTWDASTSAFGNYELRAVATDSRGNVDAAPSSILVELTDLTAPPMPENLTGQVDGTTVTLAWQASVDPGLDGYEVERTDSLGGSSLLPLAPGAGRIDAGLPFDAYSYRVRAVDDFGNASSWSAPLALTVFGLDLAQPLTPTWDPTPLVVAGRANLPDQAEVPALPLAVRGEFRNTAGAQPLPASSTNEDGLFAIDTPPLLAGSNELEVTLEAPDHISVPALVVVELASRPAAPTGLGSMVDAFDVDLTWDPAPEPNAVGYRLYDASGPLQAPAAALPSTTSASAESSPATAAANAVDGSAQTYWSPANFGPEPAWLELQFAAPAAIARVELDWVEQIFIDPNLGEVSDRFAPRNFAIEVWDGVRWSPLLAVVDNEQSVHSLTGPFAYRTDRVRIFLEDALQPSAFQPIRLTEVRVFAAELLTGTATTLAALDDGVYDLSLTTVNAFGFESDPSAFGSIAVGDTEAPEPVTLSGTLSGEDEAELTWTASPSIDVARYLLERDDIQILDTADPSQLSYVDGPLPNGSYAYTVTAVDAVGNQSLPSNEVLLTVDVLPPNPPLLSVQSSDATSVTLAWTAAPGTPPAIFTIARGGSAGGPYQTLGQTTDSTFVDETVTAGAPYSYVVFAVDSAGNPSAPSNEVSATPADTEAPAPPQILAPTRPGLPISTSALTVDVQGLAEPGARVAVTRNGAAAGETLALQQAALAGSSSSNANRTIAGPLGNRVLELSFSSQLTLHNLISGTSTALAGGVRTAAWIDGEHVAYAPFNNEIHVLDLGNGQDSILADPDFTFDFTPGPSSEQLLVAGRFAGDEGIALLDLTTGALDLRLALPQLPEQGTLQLSPSGRELALVDGSGLFVFDLETANQLLFANDATLDPPSWSSDGSTLAYASPTADAPGVRFWDVASGTISDLTANPDVPSERFLQPTFGPLADSLLATRATTFAQELVLLSLLDPAAATTLRVGPSFHDLAWAPSGVVLARQDGQSIRVALPGAFRLAQVPLEAGINRLTATQRDAVNNISAPSEEVEVTLTSDQLSDLTISSAGAAPAFVAPEETVRLSATVRNVGAVASPATALSVLGTAPDGQSFGITSTDPEVPALEPGQEFSWAADVVPAAAGIYAVTVRADPDGLVVEASESNNVSAFEFAVLSDEPPTLQVSTDRSVYDDADAQVQIAVEATNPGAARTASLEVVIEDLAGFPVQTLIDEPLVDLGFASTTSRTATFEASTVLAGDYRVSARLLLDGADFPLDASADFRIGDRSELDLRLVATPIQVLQGGPALLTATLDYRFGNALLEAVDVTLAVRSPAGVEVFSATQNASFLLPGDASEHVFGWSTAGQGEGTYLATVTASLGGTSLAQASTPIEVLLEPPALEGELDALEVLEAGDPVDTEATLTNSGGTPLDALPVQLQLRSGDLTEVLRSQSLTANVGAGSTVSVFGSLPTAGLLPGDFTLVLQAQLPNRRGTPTVLAVRPLTLTDLTAPDLEILAPASGALFGGDLTALLAASDPLSPLDRLLVTVDGTSTTTLLVGSLQSPFRLPLNTLAEGEHTLMAEAFDAFENRALAGPVSFTVDRTPPVINILGVVDGASYAQPVTPTIVVTDAHATTFTAALDGLPFVSGTEVSRPGLRRLVATAADAAGNVAGAAVTFFLTFDGSVTGTLSPADQTVDIGTPLAFDLSVTNLSTGTLAALPIRASLVDSGSGDLVQELTFSTDLTGGQTFTVTSAFDPAPLGSYRLVLAADVPADASGNVAELVLANATAEVADRTPPTVSFTTPAADELLPATFDVLAAASDLHSPVTSVEVRVGAGAWLQLQKLGAGQWAASLTAPADGSTLLELRATDAPGNTSSATGRTVTVDGTPPQITFGGFVPGQVAEGPVTPTVQFDDPNLDPSSTSTTLNGEPFEPGTVVEEPGLYQLEAEAQDLVGNSASESASFTIQQGDDEPFLLLTQPLDGTQLDAREVVVTGLALPFAQVRVVIGTATATVTSGPTGDFAFEPLPLAYGFNLVSAELVAQPAISQQVTVQRLEPGLGLTLAPAAGQGRAVSPGATIDLATELANEADGSAWNLVVPVEPPEFTELASWQQPALGDVAETPTGLVWTLPRLEPGQSAELLWSLRVAPTVPAELRQIDVQLTSSADELSDLPSDDPTTSEPNDPTRFRLVALVEIPTQGAGGRVLLALLLLAAGWLSIRRLNP